jgi:hypothetical protein
MEAYPCDWLKAPIAISFSDGAIMAAALLHSWRVRSCSGLSHRSAMIRLPNGY